jgi:threonine dehydrogenase-like Zn-dependent dehydrogenase
MNVLTYLGPESLEWRDVPAPRLQGGGEALVRPIAATPCDLDRAIVTGKTPLPGPFALGHEAVAEVVEVGDAVRRVRPGQRVVVPWHISCGGCDRCLAGLTASCRNVPPRAMYGTPIGGDFGGLFSDLVRVPFADAMLVPVPAGISSSSAAAASDNLTDAWLAVSRPLAQHPGAAVLVVGGTGAIGLYVVMCARAAGASAVTYVDRSPERLALAEALGARSLPRGSAALPEHAVVVDTSGNPAELARGLRAVAPGGQLTSVGVYFLDTPLPLLDMYANDVTFRIGRPSVGPHIARVLELVGRGEIEPLRVGVGEVPWDQAPAVLRSRALKPIFSRP